MSQGDKDSKADALANKIAAGHAFDKHANEVKNTDRDAFQKTVLQTLSAPSVVLALSGNRTLYWNDEEQFVVVLNPKDPDGGTAFWPKDGIEYLAFVE